MSLWRKRNVHHNEQNQPKLFKMTAMTHKDLSIKSEDLSIKSEPYKSTRQELREQIEGLERDYDLLLTKYKLLLAEKSPEVKESLTTEPVAYINIEKRKLEWAHDYMSWDTPTVVNLPRIPLYTTLQPAPQGEPVIAGALFDFMGWLTSRKERFVLSSADEASPAVDAIRDFAKMRGLSLDDARVQDWNTTPQQRTWVGLTNDEVNNFAAGCHLGNSVQGAIYKAEAKLKEKNT
jgi:hypothetical protein